MGSASHSIRQNASGAAQDYADAWAKFAGQIDNPDARQLLDIGLGGTGSGDKLNSRTDLLNYEENALYADQWQARTASLLEASSILEKQKEIRKTSRDQASELSRGNENPNLIAAFEAAGQRNQDTEIAKYLK